jgi:adenine deaminase
VIDLITDSLTREAIIDMPVSDGLAQLDISQDILKIAAIERTYQQGKTFVGFARGTGLKYGAIASSMPTDCWDMVVIGASDADMAQAVNRIRELHGGTVVCADNKVLAELALPIGGVVSLEPMETIADKLRNIQQAVVNLGCVLPNISNTLAFLASEAVPFLRICQQGLIDIRQNRIIDLMVD